MTILSLEFSASVRSVAVWISGMPAESQVVVTAADERKSRIHPLTLIERALTEAQVKRSEVELLAIGLGPGSYTGIRSAIAVAQGWSLGLPIQVTGVSSAEVIAEQSLGHGDLGEFHVIIDAQRDEFYVADFERTQTTVHLKKKLRILTRTEVSNLCSPLVGPELKSLRLVGTEISPSATVLGALARRKGQICAPEELVPIYLRETAFIKAPPPRVIPP